MPEPTDPKPFSYEAKMNVARARLSALQTRLEHAKDDVEPIEDAYTSPQPRTLEAFAELTRTLMKFFHDSTQVIREANELGEHVIETISRNPASDTPERAKEIGDLISGIVNVRRGAEALHTYVFSMKFPPQEPEN